MLAGSRWSRRVRESPERVRRRHDVIKRALRRAWTDALDQLKNPKPRDPVPGIFYKAQYCEEILDMSSIEEFEPAEFDEGDVSSRQLDLNWAAVVRRPKQDGLLL